MAELEAEQIRRAKESGRTPVVFVHGLWLLPSSWDRWAEFFEEDDFVALTPGWPDDPLTYEQFRYAFANAVEEDEAKALYGEFAVPAPAEPLFQAAASNLNPWTEAKVDTENPNRGPLLIVSGERDHTVPPVLANAAYERQSRNEGVTEIVEMPGRGHGLTIDHGWREVAETARAFVRRFV